MILAVSTVTPAYSQKGDKGDKGDKNSSKEDKKKEKEEKKQWKKKAKSYAKEPLSLRDDLENANKKLRELSDKNKQLQDKFARQQSTIDSLQNLLNQKISEIAALNAKYEKLQNAYEAQKKINEKSIIPGLVYKVQLGAFVHFDINKYLKDTGENFEGETADGMNKYTMGNFRDMTVADAFKKDVQKMGIKDAWIVPYIDGVRVTTNEAEEYLKKQGR